MAKVTFTNAHNYHYRYSDFGRTEVESFSKNKIVLRYTDDYDPETSPLRAVVKIKGADVYTPGQGQDSGRDMLIGGKIANIKFFGEDGKLQTKITKIDLDAGSFYFNLLEQPWNAYQNVVGGGSLFVGSSGDESGSDISTGMGDDIVRISKGGSYIKDLGGADQYLGSDDSYDTVAYDNWNYNNLGSGSGIVANLAKGTIKGPDGKTDTIVSIDEVRGTNKVDKFIGSDQDFRDQFAGLRGDDTFDGGGGFDTAVYNRDEQSGGFDGVVVDLAKGRARDGFGTTDKLISIEAARGTNQDDVFRDSRDDNQFRGYDGNDTFYLKVGDDAAEGGEGADTFIFLSTKFGNDEIWDFDGGEGDRIEIKSARSMDDLTVEQIGDDTVIRLNDNSSVLLYNVSGDVEQYLDF